MRCPNCNSLELEYVQSVDLLSCLKCSIVIWDDDLLQRYKYPKCILNSEIKAYEVFENRPIDS